MERNTFELINQYGEIFVVIVLDDNNLQECKIQYFHGDQLLDINEINNILLEEIGEHNPRDLSYNHYLNRFLACKWTIIPNYLNYSEYDREVYHTHNLYTGQTEPFRIYPLPISINTMVLLKGIEEMDILSSVFGAYTQIYISHNNKKKRLTNGRNEQFNNDAKELIYNYLSNANIEIEGIKINVLQLQEFIELFDYITENTFFKIIFNRQGPEPYGLNLYDSITRKIYQKTKIIHSKNNMLKS